MLPQRTYLVWRYKPETPLALYSPRTQGVSLPVVTVVGGPQVRDLVTGTAGECRNLAGPHELQGTETTE